MITTQLVTYIREQQALGRDEETIMKTLMDRQWKPQDIQAGFASVGAWSRTFQYVIPNAGQKPASMQPMSQEFAGLADTSLVQSRPRKRRSNLGIALFLLFAFAGAAIAFYAGFSGVLESKAPATVPNQSQVSQPAAKQTSPSPAPAASPAQPTKAQPDVSF